MLHDRNSHPELSPLLERLTRAVDRYRAVGWEERAEAMQALITLAPSLPLATIGHLEDALVGLRSRVAHYDDPPRFISLGERSEFKSSGVPDWVDRLAAAAKARKTELLQISDGATRSAAPAEQYKRVDDFCVIMSFFNPLRYRSRVKNFETVADSLTRSRIAWRAIECAFGEAPFTLPAADNIVRVRSQSVLWQKERLLNVLIRTMPDRYTKVAWIDADILFSNPAWIPETCDALDDFPVVQPFVQAAPVPRGSTRATTGGDALVSFAYLYQLDPDGVLGPTYWNHGHTGYAWAGRRDWMETHGLYDACLSGTGDHLMAHGFVGDWQPECLGIGKGAAYRHFASWSNHVYPSVRSRVGAIEGTAFSLWHGPESERGYYNAVCTLREGGFDPAADLQVGPTGCWEWASEKSWLHDWAADYFVRRRDDG
jgi:hypothetical protein